MVSVMFKGNQPNSYFSGGKRRRDSMLRDGQSTLQPFLMGTSGARSPTQKRTRLSVGGGSDGRSSELEWSSLLNFQTPLRPARQRPTTLRRRETIHALPGQPSSSLSSPSFRSGVMNASPGFMVRDRSERHSVARALQILDSRKRLRELSSNKYPDQDSEPRDSPAPAVENVNRKRRRLTINGTLEEMLQQEEAFASTSLGEIAARSASRGAGGVDASSLLQKRIFTSAIPGTSDTPTEPSSKRLRPGVNTCSISTGGNSSKEVGRNRLNSDSSSSASLSQSDAAQRRRLLSYMAPAQVEARYARQSAATELLARSRNTSRSTTPSVSRRASQVGNQLATTGAQTELSCNQKEVLQKSPAKEEAKSKEAAKTEEPVEEKVKPPGRRHCQLSVADFVAHLDRARTSTQSQRPEDTMRRTAVDGQARRERLNRLRKLLSDVTREPTPPSHAVSSALVSASKPTPQIPSVGGASSVLSALLPTSTASGTQKQQSFGFATNTAASTAITRIEPSTAVTSSAAGPGGISFGLPPAVTSTTKPSTVVQNLGLSTSLAGSIAGALTATTAATPVATIASVPSAKVGLPPSTASNAPALLPGITSATSVAPHSVTSASQPFVLGNQPAAGASVTAAPNVTLKFGQSGLAPANIPAAQPSGIKFGQQQSSTSQAPTSLAFGQSVDKAAQPSKSVAFGQPPQQPPKKPEFGGAGAASFVFGQPTATSGNPVGGFGLGQASARATQASTTTTSVLSFGLQQKQPEAAASSAPAPFSFGQAKPSSTTAAAAPTGQFAFGQSAQAPFPSAETNKEVAFGQPAAAASNPPAKTSAAVVPFSFGNAGQTPANTSAPSAGSMFGGQTAKALPTAPFSFGQPSTSDPTKKSSSATNPTAGIGLAFGQKTAGNPAEAKTSAAGGMFSFSKDAVAVKSSSGSTPGLFSFGNAKATTNGGAAKGNADAKTTAPSKVNSLPSAGGFSFSANPQGNSAQPKTTAASGAQTGLFQFGQASAGSTDSGGLFGNAAKTSTAAAAAATTTAGTTPFAFGSAATTAPAAPKKAISNAAPTAPAQPFSFGAVTANGATTAANTATSSFVFGNASKPVFAFGQAAAPAPTQAAPPTQPVGAFSFGMANQAPQQPAGPTPAAPKSNGVAGFTFHPPSGNGTNQTGSFSFGGAAAPANQIPGPTATPFSFGGQAPSTPAQPAAGNLFSQTATAPRKKSNPLRKRNTRK